MPDVTIVVEWDNPHIYSGDVREQRALDALAARLREIGGTAEILHVCRDADEQRVREVSARHFADFDVRVIAAGAATYYEMKNAGADAARGGIVVLCDTDCELEPGAIRALLAPFGDAARKVVAGAAYIDPRTFAGRAWSLMTVFPPRTSDDSLERTNTFLANFVAFRRDVSAFRFPSHGRLRTQCYELAAELRRLGIDVWRARGARTRHAAPEGLRGFVQRAMWTAYDAVAIHAARPLPRGAAGLRALVSLNAVHLRRMWRLVTQWRAYGIPAAEVPLQAVVMVAFCALELLLVPFAVMHPKLPRWAE